MEPQYKYIGATVALVCKCAACLQDQNQAGLNLIRGVNVLTPFSCQHPDMTREPIPL